MMLFLWVLGGSVWLTWLLSRQFRLLRLLLLV